MGNVSDAMKRYENERPKEQKPEKVAETDKQPSASEPRVYTLPQSASSNGYSPLLVAHHDRGGTLTEQYRSLRTNVLAHSRQGCLCMAVTSAEAGEGKTVTCLNLALVLAELPEIRVIVVDGDLRKGVLTSLVNAKKTPGLADVLRGTCSLNDAIQPTLYSSLDVISSGVAKRSEIGEVVGKFEKSETVSKLQRQYDCVLIDTPAVSMVSDACVLAHAVGEVLLVVRMHKTNQSSVQRTASLLRAADIKISGMFLTHQKDYVPSYFDRYY